MADRERVIADLSTALVQMHGCGRYTPEDVDELETAAWGALKLLEKESMTPFEVLERISSSYGGKQIFFQQKNGTIYDRYEGEYITLEEAVDRMAARVGSEAGEDEMVNRKWLTKAAEDAEKWMEKAPYLCYDLAKELIIAAKEVTKDEHP